MKKYKLFEIFITVFKIVLSTAGLATPFLLIKKLHKGEKPNGIFIFLCGFLSVHGLRTILLFLQGISGNKSSHTN